MTSLKLFFSIIALGLFVGLTGCQTFIQATSVALDRAQTVSSAFALRDGYVHLKAHVIENFHIYTPEEQDIIKSESAKVELFFQRIIDLSGSENTSEMLVNADEFLSVALVARSSVNKAIGIIQPKIGLFSSDGAVAAGHFIASYQKLSIRADESLAKNNRAEAVRMTATFLKAAVPVITSLIAR